MENSNKKKIVKMCIIVCIAVILITIIISIIIKYQVEGEKNMPFKLSKIMVISSAQGVQKEDSENKWELELVQNNDIYIDITKNKNYKKTEIISKIVLDNFNIDKKPVKGIIKEYRPNDKENGVYTNSEEYLINDSLEYTGKQKSNIKNLEVANQGGLILLRYVNEGLGKYISDQEEQIKHDGTLLAKIGINNEEIKYEVSFSILIILESEKTYKADVKLEMPIGNIIEEGTSSYEKTDCSDIIFKRD